MHIRPNVFLLLSAIVFGCAVNSNTKMNDKDKYPIHEKTETIVLLDTIDYSNYVFYETNDVKIEIKYFALWNYWEDKIARQKYKDRNMIHLRDTIGFFIEQRVNLFDISKLKQDDKFYNYVERALADLMEKGEAKVFDKRVNKYADSIIVDHSKDIFDFMTGAIWRAFKFKDKKNFFKITDAVI